MKKTAIILSIVFSGIVKPIFSQTKISTENACSYYGENLAKSIIIFNADYTAQNQIKRITDAAGLPSNFKIVAGNVPNACATLIWNSHVKGYDRYIIYNPEFMSQISAISNNWASLSILAHEIGHHLSGHSLLTGGSKPEIELEADKFAGFILAQLGAELKDAQVALNLITEERYSLTHPPRSSRIASTAVGWFSGNRKSTVSSANNKPDLRKHEIYSELTFKKTSSDYFTIKHNPSNYSLNSSIDYITLRIDELILVYLNDANTYFLLDNFNTLPVSTEKYLKYETFRDAIFIRAPSGGFWLFDKGISVENIETISTNGSLNGSYGYYVLRSKKTGRRYWIDKSTYLYGSYYKINGVYSE